MTWHSCSVFGCQNTERKKLACVKDCIFKSPNQICSHEKRHPNLQNIKFYKFPQELSLKKAWLHFIRRKDIKSVSAITANHTVCSVHFMLGLGPVKVDPIPTIHAESSPLYEKPKLKRKLPYERSALRENKENIPCEKKRSFCESTHDQEVEIDNRAQLHQEKNILIDDHSYAATGNCLSTQTNLTGENISDLLDMSEHYQDRTTLKRELFIEDVIENDQQVKFYTGFQNRPQLMAVFEVLKTAADKLCYSGNGNDESPSKPYMDSEFKMKPGPPRKLSLFEEFVMTLIKIRLNFPEEFLSSMFGVSLSRVSQIFNTWINFLYHELKFLIKWPTREQIEIYLPNQFINYPNTVAIVDCTEIFIQKPTSPSMQSKTWSDYKHSNTFKLFVAISPNGHFTFLSSLYSGRISDRDIVSHCGFLNMLSEGDDIMADRGFAIRDLLLLRKCTLNIPPFSKGKPLTSREVTQTRRIARSRIHVERAIGYLKNFKILQGVIPLKLLPVLDQVITVCAAICNMGPPLVR